MNKNIMIVASAAIVLSLGACAIAPAHDGGTTKTPTGLTTTAPVLSGTINAGGSSAQTAAQEAWRAGFQKANPSVTVNYDPTGSGTGRKNFTDGGYLLAGTDSAFSVEAAAGPFAACAPGSALVEVPAYISPIAIGFTLGSVKSLNLDAETIAKIFSGKITAWNDPAIAKQNPGANLPNMTITPVHRSDSSGTTENFTDYLAKAAPATWSWPASHTWPTELAGEAAEKTQGMRETIASTTGAIGYLDASQAAAMGTVAVKVQASYVAYSANAAAAAVGKSPLQSGRSDTDIVISLDRTLGDPGVYPVVLVSYLAACQTYANPADGALVKGYLRHVVSEPGQRAAAENAGSAPISSDPTLAAKVSAAVEAIS